jgi:hypothetical protein
MGLPMSSAPFAVIYLQEASHYTPHGWGKPHR